MAALSCTHPGDWGTLGQGRWGAVPVPSRAVLSGGDPDSPCSVRTSSNSFFIVPHAQQNDSEEQADRHGKEEVQHGSQKGKRSGTSPGAGYLQTATP